MLYFNKNIRTGISRSGRLISGLFIFYLVVGIGQAFAQERIRVKVGQNIESHEFASTIYRFPIFNEGIIHYNNGGMAKGKLNYHQLLGEMHFIGPKGDTMAMDNLYMVKFVAVGNAKFYYDPEGKGFGEEIADFKAVKLLIKQKFKPSDKEKGVAYGQYSNTSATKTYNTFAANGQIQKLNPNEYLVFSKQASYYLTDQNNHFYLANKASFLKVFSRHKPKVEKFIKENKIDFQKEADLKELLSFAAGLN